MATDDSVLKDRVGKKSSILSMLDSLKSEPIARVPPGVATPGIPTPSIPTPSMPTPEPSVREPDLPGYPASPDGTDPLPHVGDEYKAHARMSNKPLPMLAFLTRDMPLDGFSYSDLRRIRLLPPSTPDGGPVLVLWFVETEKVEVRIEGRNLLLLANYLLQHRIAWVRLIPPGRKIADANAAVITGITIRPVK